MNRFMLINLITIMKNCHCYINKKIKYEDIVDKLDKVNKGIKIYEKNQNLYKNSPNIFQVAKCQEPGSIDLSWMHDPELYEEISQDVFGRYNKDKDSNELLSIQSILDNINDEYIKNKKDALNEFKTVKDNVKSKNLKDIVKELELVIFGYDDEESEYEESIAKITKMRRQSKDTDKKMHQMD